jgi:hypothetical protein
MVRVMKRAAVYSLIVGLLAAGCGSTARRVGSLAVGVKLAGGPPTAVGRLVEKRVAIFDRAGRVVRVLHTQNGHTATAEQLPPGAYTVGFGRKPPTTFGLGGCPPKVANVAAGRTTRYTLWFGCSYR